MVLQKPKSFLIDIQILLLTAYVVLKPNSDILFKVIKNLPKRPNHL